MIRSSLKCSLDSRQRDSNQGLWRPQQQRYESGGSSGRRHRRHRRRWLAADDCTQADEIMKPADLQRLASDGEAAVAAAGCSAPPRLRGGNMSAGEISWKAG